MAEGSRVFNINGNYIEKQEIHVENGGVLNFGAPEVLPTEGMRGRHGDMPPELTTPKAQRMIAALCEAGIVDNGFTVCDASLSKQAIVAEEVCKKLFIGEDIHWALFEKMWGVKNLRSKDKSLNQEYRARVKEAVAVGTGKRKM